MFFAPSRVRALAAAVMMLFAVESYAANEIKVQPKAAKEVKELIQKKSRYTPEERELERQRRVGVIDRANTVFTLLGGEMALQKKVMPASHWRPIWCRSTVQNLQKWLNAPWKWRCRSMRLNRPR